MLTMLLMLMMMSSLMFMFLINPLTMVFMLLIQTFIVSSISAIFISSFWYSYMLIMIMISGLIILFMYMASIASNEKMIFSFNATIPAMLVLLFFKSTEVLMFMKESYLNNNLMYQELIMNKLFNSKFITPSIMMIMFLFMMMVVISFIVSKTEGPMRKSN